MLDWLGNELGPPARRRVDEHLRGCAACRETGASFMWIRALVRQLPEEEPPAAASVRLVHEAARHALGASGAPPWSRLWSRLRAWIAGGMQLMGAHPAAAAVATLVLVAGVAGTMHLRGRDMVALQAPSAAPPASPPPAMESMSAPAPVVAAAGEAESDKAVSAETYAAKSRAVRADAKDDARPPQEPRREKKVDTRRSRQRSVGQGVASGRGAASGGSRADDALADMLGGVATAAPGGAEGSSAVPAQESLDERAPRAAAPAPTADGTLARGPAVDRQPADRDAERRQDAVEGLHQAVRQALHDGQCRTALRFARTLRQRDPAYHRAQVAPDAALQACQRALAAEAGKAGKSVKSAKGKAEDTATREKAAGDGP